MRSIWRVISTLVLVTAFLALAVFSLEEYRSDNIDAAATTDKLPLATTALSMFSYLEKMPMIRLLPAVSSATDYENQMTKILDKNQVDVPVSIAAVKNKVAKNIKNNPQNINFESLWQQLKTSLNKDWSQP